MWTGGNDTKTISVDANLFEKGAKQLRFRLKTDQCGQGLTRPDDLSGLLRNGLPVKFPVNRPSRLSGPYLLELSRNRPLTLVSTHFLKSLYHRK